MVFIEVQGLLAAERISRELHYGCWQKRRFQGNSIVVVDRRGVSRKTTLHDLLAVERILKELHYGCWQQRRFS